MSTIIVFSSIHMKTRGFTVNIHMCTLYIADHSESEKEEEEEEGAPTERPEGTSFPTHSNMEVMEEDSHSKLVDCNVGNYDWLVEHFKSEK